MKEEGDRELFEAMQGRMAEAAQREREDSYKEALATWRAALEAGTTQAPLPLPPG